MDRGQPLQVENGQVDAIGNKEKSRPKQARKWGAFSGLGIGRRPKSAPMMPPTGACAENFRFGLTTGTRF